MPVRFHDALTFAGSAFQRWECFGRCELLLANVLFAVDPVGQHIYQPDVIADVGAGERLTAINPSNMRRPLKRIFIQPPLFTLMSKP